MISPKESQTDGLVTSVATGLIVFAAIWWLFVSYLHFWYIHQVLGPVFGFIGGCLSAYAMFASGQGEIELYYKGIGLTLGKPNGKEYTNGKHWFCPVLRGARLVPTKAEKFELDMPGEEIDAQDGAPVFFGLKENGGKVNTLQYSIVDWTLYLPTKDPGRLLKSAYLQGARLFFGQLSKAIGVKNVRKFFSEFLMLEPRNDPAVPPSTHVAFENQLRAATFQVKDKDGNIVATQERLFSDPSVDAIMADAGKFLSEAAGWGIGNITVFIPNARENPVAEAANMAKEQAKQKMVVLETNVNKIRELAQGPTADGVSQDLAWLTVTALSGQPVELKHETFDVPGLKEVVQSIGEKAIKAYLKSNAKGAT